MSSGSEGDVLGQKLIEGVKEQERVAGAHAKTWCRCRVHAPAFGSVPRLLTGGRGALFMVVAVFDTSVQGILPYASAPAAVSTS